MEKYNYQEVVREDVRNYVDEYLDYNEIKVTEENKDDLFETLNDEIWVADSVTGNGSGSYTFNTWKAEENLCHNLDLLMEVFRDWGGDLRQMESPEACDVAIRCYLFPQYLTEYLEELAEA